MIPSMPNLLTDIENMTGLWAVATQASAAIALWRLWLVDMRVRILPDPFHKKRSG
jgi:hypothetical protein